MSDKLTKAQTIFLEEMAENDGAVTGWFNRSDKLVAAALVRMGFAVKADTDLHEWRITDAGRAALNTIPAIRSVDA